MSYTPTKRKFLPLVTNENIKIFKQTGFRVLLIIFAVIAVLIPLVFKGLDLLETSGWEYTDEDTEYWEECYRDNLNTKNYGGAIYYQTQYEFSRFLIDNQISRSSVVYLIYCGYEGNGFLQKLTNYNTLNYLNSKICTFEKLSETTWGELYDISDLYVEKHGPIPSYDVEFFLDTFSEILMDETIANFCLDSEKNLEEITKCIQDLYTEKYGSFDPNSEVESYLNAFSEILMDETFTDLYSNSEIDLEEINNNILNLYIEKFNPDELDYMYSFSQVLTDEIIAELYADAEKDLTEIKNSIRNFDIRTYYTGLSEEAKMSFESAKATLEELKKAKGSEYGTGVEFESRLANMEKSVALWPDVLDGYDFLLKNGCEYSGWEHNTVIMMEKAASQLGELWIVSREQFDEDTELSLRFSDYNDYKKQSDKIVSACVSSVELGKYSLEHNAPLEDSAPDSTSALFLSQLNIVVRISALILIVMAGTILSSEYSSGTIRLLLIRPRSRTKILCSKMVSLLFYWILILLFAFVFMMIEDLILFGKSTLFLPRTVFIGGKIFCMNFLLVYLGRLLLSMFCSLPGILLAFFISVLIRRAALAIALPLIFTELFMAGQTLSSLLYYNDNKFILWTPFPYLDLTKFLFTPASLFFESSLNELSEILEILTGYSGDVSDLFFYHPLVGFGYILAINVIFIVLSIVLFKKQQIKN